MESQKIKVRDEYLTELGLLHILHEKQWKWLYDGKLDDQEFENSLEDIFKKETRDLFVKYAGFV